MTETVMKLLEQKDFTKLKIVLADIYPQDLALLFEELDNKETILIFRLLPKELASETFAYLESDVQISLVNSFSDKETREIFNNLFIDDTVDIIEEMPASVVTKIIKNTSAENRKAINEILHYPGDSAGSIMTIEFIHLQKNMTVAEAIEKIRRVGVHKEHEYTCYVTENRRLLGVITVSELLCAADDEKVCDLMETNVISVNTHDDKEFVAKQLSKYDYMALPVVDKEQRLVGIVTFDDAIDVIVEENTEDFSKMAAVTPNEDSYFKTSVFTHSKNRIFWLMVLMLSSTFTGMIITKYQNAFLAYPILASFIPMLMSTGGNCGSQSSMMVIRGIALDVINFKDIFRVILKELRISLIVGALLTLVNFIRIVILYNSDPYLFGISLVASVSLFLVVVFSKFIGCTLPLIAHKFKLDPALMASPIISTIVDACAMFIYFNVATAVLQL